MIIVYGIKEKLNPIKARLSDVIRTVLLGFAYRIRETCH